MTRTLEITGIIVLIIVIAAIAYFAFIYESTLRTQPSQTAPQTTQSVAPANTTLPQTSNITEFTPFSRKEINISSKEGANLSVTAPDGVNITVHIPVGTFALINNVTHSNYTFTLATFNIKNLGNPAGYANQSPAYGFAFEVDGQITPTIDFTNSTKAPMPLTTTAKYPDTWGSWAFLGGEFNLSSGIYSGGNYVLQNSWSYNSISGIMTNTQFYKPIMWVFTIGPAHQTVVTIVNKTTTSTESSNTVNATATNTMSHNTTTTASGGYNYG